VSVLQGWLPSANVRCVCCKSRPALFIGLLSFREDQNQGHWYSSVLNNAQVQDFLDNYANLSIGDSPSVKEFTLTVYAPQDCGSLYGWKIECVLLPGRHAKFHFTFRFQGNNNMKAREASRRPSRTSSFPDHYNKYKWLLLYLENSPSRITRLSCRLLFH